jgi:ATP-grasp domain
VNAERNGTTVPGHTVPGRTVLVVDSNSAGSGAAALLAARARGYRTHFLARDPAEYRRLDPGPPQVADEVTVVDTFDVTKMLRAVDGGSYAAVLAYDELRVVQAAVLGGYLGVPHNPPVEAVLRTRFKDLTRAALAGTPWAVRYAAGSLDDRPAESPVGYPCVVKPPDEAASVGVRICPDRRAFTDALARLRGIAGRRSGRGYQRMREFLVEELLTGPEYSAELVWSAARQDWRLIGYTAKITSAAPACIELGHLFPHRFPPVQEAGITASLAGCLRQLGLRDTLAHVEFRLDDGQVRLIEVNPRPAGGPIPALVRAVTGTGLADLHVAAHLGDADAVLDAMTCAGYAGAAFLVPGRPGRVTGFDVRPGLDLPATDLRVAGVPRDVRPGASNEDRLGYVLARGDSPNAVAALLARRRAGIQPRYAAAGAA